MQDSFVAHYKLYIKKDRLYIDNLWQGGIVEKIIHVTYNFKTDSAEAEVEDVTYSVN